MIESISLKFGAHPYGASLHLDGTPVTVFVGPNNSGKSKVLQEIQGYCQRGLKNTNDVILDRVSLSGSGFEPSRDFAEKLVVEPGPKARLKEGEVLIGRGKLRTKVDFEDLITWLENPEAHKRQFCKTLMNMFVLMLDGRRRINLLNDVSMTDLQAPPESPLDILFRSNDKRFDVRRIVYEAFGKYFVLDPTKLGQLRVRLSDIEPPTEEHERGITGKAVEFHRRAPEIATASDGTKAFAGIITEIIAGDPRIILVDEPEAFLHPALSYKLGKEIVGSASDTNKRIFASTHSANFVMGCVQSGARVNIVRLTYRDNVGTARCLASDKLLELMRKPLLRSTGVLQGLFYESVIVTESDTDRAFYDEINTRLQRLDPPRGIPNCLFLNAQNKTTIHEIVKPLRELGIPSAAIVDIDIVKNGGKDWQNFLAAGNIPDMSKLGLGQSRSVLRGGMDETGKDMKRDGGIEVLGNEGRQAANDLFDQLDSYGLFVVRCGELESWLPELKSNGHGPPWLIETFELMGDDPNDSSYLNPSEGDVWKFLDDIGKWLGNSDRKGIPSE
ncbi:ATP-dependent nuclease [Adhaeretor mobilis]|nr:ATP-binding protein [Adhaeretor mobilis]